MGSLQEGTYTKLRLTEPEKGVLDIADVNSSGLTISRRFKEKVITSKT